MGGVKWSWNLIVTIIMFAVSLHIEREARKEREGEETKQKDRRDWILYVCLRFLLSSITIRDRQAFSGKSSDSRLRSLS